jgi:hypothetical protein
MVAAVFVIAAIPRQVVCEVLPELTTVSSVRALKPDQANSARPVWLRGVVTVLFRLEVFVLLSRRYFRNFGRPNE